MHASAQKSRSKNAIPLSSIGHLPAAQKEAKRDKQIASFCAPGSFSARFRAFLPIRSKKKQIQRTTILTFAPPAWFRAFPVIDFLPTIRRTLCQQKNVPRHIKAASFHTRKQSRKNGPELAAGTKRRNFPVRTFPLHQTQKEPSRSAFRFQPPAKKRKRIHSIILG